MPDDIDADLVCLVDEQGSGIDMIFCGRSVRLPMLRDVRDEVPLVLVRKEMFSFVGLGEPVRIPGPATGNFVGEGVRGEELNLLREN